MIPYLQFETTSTHLDLSLLFFVVGLLDLFFSARVPASNWILGTSLIIVFFLISLVLIMDHPDPWACPSLRQRLWAKCKNRCRRYTHSRKLGDLWNIKRASDSDSSDDSSTAAGSEAFPEQQRETEALSPSSQRLVSGTINRLFFFFCPVAPLSTSSISSTGNDDSTPNVYPGLSPVGSAFAPRPSSHRKQACRSRSPYRASTREYEMAPPVRETAPPSNLIRIQGQMHGSGMV